MRFLPSSGYRHTRGFSDLYQSSKMGRLEELKGDQTQHIFPPMWRFLQVCRGPKNERALDYFWSSFPAQPWPNLPENRTEQ